MPKMCPFVPFAGLVVPLDRPSVDTDAIIPKQYLLSIRRSGFGPYLFDDWRYLDPGVLDQDPGSRRLNPEFVLNRSRYRGAEILLARENYGCGSSREHAVWAMLDYGFRAVLAPSFADIFYDNAYRNGLLPVLLEAAVVERLFGQVSENEGYRLEIDLERQSVVTPDGERLPFEIAPGIKQRLLRGWDDISISLQQAERIRAYEERRRCEAPWLYSPAACANSSPDQGPGGSLG